MFIHDIICNQGCRGINTVGAEHLLPTPTLLTAAVISFQTRCLCLFNASFQPGNNLIFFCTCFGTNFLWRSRKVSKSDFCFWHVNNVLFFLYIMIHWFETQPDRFYRTRISWIGWNCSHEMCTFKSNNLLNLNCLNWIHMQLHFVLHDMIFLHSFERPGPDRELWVGISPSADPEQKSWPSTRKCHRPRPPQTAEGSPSTLWSEGAFGRQSVLVVECVHALAGGASLSSRGRDRVLTCSSVICMYRMT